MRNGIRRKSKKTADLRRFASRPSMWRRRGSLLTQNRISASAFTTSNFENGLFCPLLPKIAKIRHEIRHVRHGTV